MDNRSEQGSSGCLIAAIIAIVLMFAVPVAMFGYFRDGKLQKGGAAVAASGDACVSPLGVEVLNDAGFAKAIDAFITRYHPNSPFAGLGKDFVAAGKQYKVNPTWVVSIANKESSLGTAGDIATGEAKNSFGRRAADGQPQVNGWYKYSSYKQSIYDQTEFLRRAYIDGRKITTIEAAMRIYAPPSENDTTTYVAQVTDWMNKMISAAGSAVSCSVGGGNIVTIAKAQLGLKENPVGSYSGSEIQKFLGSSKGEKWCADFVSWVYKEAGKQLPGSVDEWRIPGAKELADTIADKGTWIDQTDRNGSPPAPGDVFLTKSSETQYHVGIVISVTDTAVTTVSGNTNHQVGQTTFANYRESKTVLGWGRL